MEKYRGIIIAAIGLLLLILVAGKFLLGRTGGYNYGPMTVDEQAVSALLSQSPVMETGRHTAPENEARLKNATRCIRDKIFIRLAHFTNLHVQMDCDKEVKDIMLGIAEGLRDAGIIDEDRCNEEMNSIEATLKSVIFPDLVPYNFCGLVK